MLNLASRRVYFVALAVPITMVIAPLTASAGEPDEAVVTEHAHAAAIATDDAAAAAASTNTTTTTDEESDDLTFFPGPDWYEPNEVNVTYYDSDDVNVTYVVNGIHEDSVTGNYEEDDEVISCEVEYENPCGNEATYEEEDEATYEATDTAAVAVVPVHEVDVTENDDDLSEWTEDGSIGVSYSDVAAGAGPEGAWASSTESGAFTDGDDVTFAYYEEVTAAAGSDGAFVESIESGAGEFGDYGDDDVTGAYHEKVVAYAGADGAWVGDTESGAAELD